MERIMGTQPMVASSFSLHSMAEGSEPCISEAEEIKEVENLRVSGKSALEIQNYPAALSHYSDALEIDEHNVESLCGRAEVYLQLGKSVLAQLDIERVIGINPKHAKALRLQGIVLGQLGYYRESLGAFLKSVENEKDVTQIEDLADKISLMASKYCPMPNSLVDKLSDMEPYKQLCEVAACLFQSRRYDICIRVLNVALKLETNQKGITMKVQLTLANAHSALKHRDLAISLYLECLNTAVATHDIQYQTKALVSIASLFLEIGDTHQAIIYYEKLLQLQTELQGEDEKGSLPEYWSSELQCALHLNLSIAYKSIGSMHRAIQHAKVYVKLMEGKEMLKKNAEALSHQNIGTLYEVLGQYEKALHHYKTFQEMSRNKGDKHSVAQSYGCLGSVYGQLKNFELAKTYHEQHVHAAQTLEDILMLTAAHELKGDTQMLLEQFEEASEDYLQMFQNCNKNDVRMQTVALCKLGQAYKAQKKFQYSMYYFEQAKLIAEDFNFDSVRAASEFHLATMLQHSTQMTELDQSRKYIEYLIPLIETKLHQHEQEGSFVPQELKKQLQVCYSTIQNVLAKLGKKEECLEYTESSKDKFMSDYSHIKSAAQTRQKQLWNLDHINGVVSQQNATVIYYSFVERSMHIWVLQPGEGIVRFYASKATSLSEVCLEKQIQEVIVEIKSGKKEKNSSYGSEHRALPYKNRSRELLMKKNEQLSSNTEKDTDSVNHHEDKNKGTNNKSADQRLFSMLFSPVYDVLCKLETDSPIVIIPDGTICDCPFTIIKDWSGKRLGDIFRITIIPNLHALESVVHNELNQLQVENELEFDRNQSRMGGMPRTLAGADIAHTPRGLRESNCCSSNNMESMDLSNVNRKRVANPRLAASGLLQESLNSSENTKEGYNQKFVPSSKLTFHSLSPRNVMYSSIQTNPMHHVGMPTPVECALGAHTLNTLTTKTATNTDITSSSLVITEFKQVSDHNCVLIIGNPLLPANLQFRGETFHPPRVMKAAQAECEKVAEHFNVTPVMAKLATKTFLLEEIPSASMIHIASLADLQEGYIAMAPDPKYLQQSGQLDESVFLVTAAEIATCQLRSCQLVVLSAGWGSGGMKSSTSEQNYLLPRAFLAAGAQCVLTLLWPVPNIALDKFYHHFYQNLREGLQVTVAVREASKTLEKDNRYTNMVFWSPFILIGKDVTVSVKAVRHAMLNQQIDRAEKDVALKLNSNLLNPAPTIPDVPSHEEKLNEVQSMIGGLLANNTQHPTIIPILIDLLDGALKRLHVEDNNRKLSRLPDVVVGSDAGLGLLRLLGYHFQFKGAQNAAPYVLYPHWNEDEFLVPVYDALRAIADFVHSALCTSSLFGLLPTTQETISQIVDLLCITKNAQDVQLKVTDLSVRPLWYNPKVKDMLMSFGFHQIGVLLNFHNIPSNRKLLSAGLQLFISLSTHKSAVLMHKLDVQLLGDPYSKMSTESYEPQRLPSLTPILLPRNQLRMSTPWLSSVEKSEEMDEKMKLSKSKSDLATEFQQHFVRAKTWHQTSIGAQGNESLACVGRPKTSPLKVKVVSGSGTSQPRLPVEREPTLDLKGTDKRRDYATFVLNKRLDNVSLRHKNDVRKLYLPYIANI